MIDGLDEAVTGLSAGESAEFASTLVGGPLEGEPADIKVTVTKVSEQELPAVDDEFAQLVSEFDTVDEMRADLAQSIDELARLEQAAKGRDKVLEALVEKVELELPERLLTSEIEARKEQINDQLKRAGLSLERYLEQAEEEARTPEEFWAELESSTEKGLKAQLVLDKVADDSEVGIEQADLSELLVRKAAQAGTSPEQEAQHMMEHNHTGAWMQEIRRNKALALIVAEATVTDTDGNPVDVSGAPETSTDE
jgi:trigger factor